MCCQLKATCHHFRKWTARSAALSPAVPKPQRVVFFQIPGVFFININNNFLKCLLWKKKRFEKVKIFVILAFIATLWTIITIEWHRQIGMLNQLNHRENFILYHTTNIGSEALRSCRRAAAWLRLKGRWDHGRAELHHEPLDDSLVEREGEAVRRRSDLVLCLHVVHLLGVCVVDGHHPISHAHTGLGSLTARGQLDREHTAGNRREVRATCVGGTRGHMKEGAEMKGGSGV